MRFADPQACPDCRGVISGQPACPHCGLDLTSIEVRQLWQVLLQADQLLGLATRHPRTSTAPVRESAPGPPAATADQTPPVADPASVVPPAPTPAPTPADPVSAVHPAWRLPSAPPSPSPLLVSPFAAPFTGPPRAAPKERSWSAGTILLILGALGLVVAGLIFVTRSWEYIGLTGRTLILLGVTAVIGGLGVWVTRRPLRASAEAVWAVFLTLLTLDFFAARHENLARLGALDVAGGWIVWGVIALGLSVAIGLWARPHVSADLVVAAVAGGLAIAIAGIGAGASGNDWDYAWRAVAALVVAGLLALSTRPAALAPLTLVARGVVAVFYVFAYVASMVELFDHPTLDDLAGGAHGAPLLLMGVASIVVAQVVPVVRIPAVALAVVAGSALVATPVIDAGGDEVTMTVVTLLATALAAATARGTSAWMRGARLGVVPAVVAVVVVQIVLVSDALETIGRVLRDPWRLTWDVRLDVFAVPNYAAWVVPIVLLGLLATTWFVARWPEISVVRKHAAAAVCSALAVGGVTSVVALRCPVWLVAASLVLLAAGMAVVRLRRIATVPTGAAFFVVVFASALAAASQGVSAMTWTLGGLVLLAISFVGAERRLVVRQAYAAIGTVGVLAGAATFVGLLDVDDAVTPLAAVVVALALIAAAQLAASDHPVAPVIEAAAATGLIVALVWPGTSGEIAVRWTIAGVALIALSFVAAGRRWLVWPGLAALVVAYVALIVDSGFSFVEAYTLPLGAVGLAVGLYLATTRTETNTWALLGPGLAVALLPSVPQALADPTDLRALLLGAGALAVLAIGIRLGWQAPFVAGVTILLLLVLFNIGPYANAAPRVVLIALLGAISMGLGITWEDRVRDGRKLVTYVRSMR